MKIVILCVLGCAIMVLAGVKSDVVNSSVSCSEGWFEFDGRCFHFVQKPMSWSEAEENCLSMGAHLASVDNVQEYREIQKQIVAATNSLNDTWIGGSDAQLEGDWFWSDGNIFNFSNWCPREPNNALGSQHCLRINYGDKKCGDDFHCDFSHQSVCAKKVKRILD